MGLTENMQISFLWATLKLAGILKLLYQVYYVYF